MAKHILPVFLEKPRARAAKRWPFTLVSLLLLSFVLTNPQFVMRKGFFFYDTLNNVLRFDKELLSKPLEIEEYFKSKYNVSSGFLKAVNGQNYKDVFYSMHSHNDYWRKTPFLDALERNYKSVEADVWFIGSYSPQSVQNQFDGAEVQDTNRSYSGDLFVGHHLLSLSARNTLDSLYLDKMRFLINDLETERQDAGFFYNHPNETLQFLIDIKTSDSVLVYQVLKDKFSDLQNYLSYYDYAADKFVPKQITVVLSGNVPLEMLLKKDMENVAKPEGAKQFFFVDMSMVEYARGNLDLGSFKRLAGLASISYPELVAYGALYHGNSVCDAEVVSKRILPESQIAYLRNTTESIAQQLGINTRIWGIPSIHFGKNKIRSCALERPFEWVLRFKNFLNWLYQFFGTKYDENVESLMWQDLVLNGGITMINIDDLDYGLRLYNEVWG